jgi:hypothetical protein
MRPRSIRILAVTAGVASFLTSGVLLLAFAGPKGSHSAAAQPQSEQSAPHCTPVGGTVMTNFGAFGADNPNSTMGTATGDMRGAVSGTLVGAPVSSGNTVIFHVQHHWVTETGDILFFQQATATTVPISPGLFAILTYPVHLVGGTGKFAGATGDFTNIGEVSLPNAPDVAGGTTIFRYTGQVCFATQDAQ